MMHVLHKQTFATSQIEVADKVRARRLGGEHPLLTEQSKLRQFHWLMVNERAA